MTATEIHNEILQTARQLTGIGLPYLAGANNITITEVTDTLIRANRTEGPVTIPLDAVEELAQGLQDGTPVHVDTLFHSKGNYRTALETIAANSPYCGYLPANSRRNQGPKKLVWFSERIHETGKTLDATNLMEQIQHLKSSASLFQNTPISRALLAKPFLILTGPSGTGKTRSAIQLAEHLCEAERMAVVAVGADWTDNRHVLGFLNPLQTEDGTPTGIPIYETTEILNLLLHANAHPHEPHVLILDEMNLSHVERYFADFLSAMELENKQNALNLHSARTAKTREGIDVSGSIDFPANLFVIGTVNIDETTYMFSPKVLDRANVIEIHPEKTELENFLKATVAVKEVEVIDYGISFLEVAQIIRTDSEHSRVPLLPEAVRINSANRLMDLFEIMQRGRGEFGFRTGREVLSYLRAMHFLTPESARAAWLDADGGWLDALDTQILQKILPKLHGSRSRMAPLLGALATYCANLDKADALKHFPQGGNLPQRGLNEARNLGNPKLKNSYHKLDRMIEVLVEEQFASFIC